MFHQIQNIYFFSANTKIWLDLEYSILTLTKVMLFSDPPNVEGGRRLDTVSVMGEWENPITAERGR